MTTICGHDAEALTWALRITCAEGDSVLGTPPYPMHNQPMSVQRADADLADPAKLAELLAESLRKRGVGATVLVASAETKTFWAFSGDCQRPILYSIELSITLANMWSVARFDLPQARAALLRVLSLPEGATADDAVKAAQ
jgi:hypothetical protein